ncbi:MAG: hypothetical protein IJG88_00960, partial [Eggerthellaceae bacterium]|nr:hypothetical protein [Eggerthellaceae bacterium]
PRFTLNSFIVVVLIFSTIAYFFTITLVDMADSRAVNDYFAVEGTDYAIVYSNKKENGIYEGLETSAELKLAGSFGHDWGVAVNGPYLYVNEYRYTEMGFIHSSVVRVDTRSWTKELLLNDAMIRGVCASGELVCVAGFAMPATFPETNPLVRLYAMAGPAGMLDGDGLELAVIDPATAETVAEFADESSDGSYGGRYLELTMDEILAEAA